MIVLHLQKDQAVLLLLTIENVKCFFDCSQITYLNCLLKFHFEKWIFFKSWICHGAIKNKKKTNWIALFSGLCVQAQVHPVIKFILTHKKSSYQWLLPLPTDFSSIHSTFKTKPPSQSSIFWTYSVWAK